MRIPTTSCSSASGPGSRRPPRRPRAEAGRRPKRKGVTALTEPLVSVVIIFLDEERFLGQAVESVLAQTHRNWEILLVDDGSTDQSAAIARRYAEERPDRIRYLQHPGGENRGMSAARNLGIGKASGIYLAFLDGDDLWLPEKLEHQVAVLKSRSSAALVYGRTEYFFDTGDPASDRARSWVQPHGIAGDEMLEPLRSLALFLSGGAAVPPPCGLLARRSVVEAVGGFEERFRGLYEDQAFYAKVCLRHPIWVSNACLDRYRQHSSSATARAAASTAAAARREYLDWVAHRARGLRVDDARFWKVLARERWLAQPRGGTGRLARLAPWLAKWQLKLEDAVIPGGLHRRLWRRRAARLGRPYSPATGARA